MASGSKTTLFLVKHSDDIIRFGDRNQLRKVLNLAVGDARQAHHIIPWGKSGHRTIQKAAGSIEGLHLNDALNGIPISNAIHNGSHAAYDLKVIAKLNDIPSNLTPTQTYHAVLDVINEIRTAIINSPLTPLDNLIF